VLYYGYFKQAAAAMAAAPNRYDGLTRAVHELSQDNTTEHPSTINVLARFNVWPEVAIAALHGAYLEFHRWSNPHATNATCYGSCRCFSVDDSALGPSKKLFTCVGLGHPIFFYLECVWHMAGLHAASIFLLCYELSNESLIAGVAGVIAAAYNVGQACRYAHAPALRESFGFPAFVLQIAIVVHVLRTRCTSTSTGINTSTSTSTSHRASSSTSAGSSGSGSAPSRWVIASIVATTVWFCVSWQLAQFALLTQSTSLCGVYLLGYISHSTHNTLQGAVVSGYVVASAIMMGNALVLTAPLIPFAVSAVTIATATGDGRSLITRVISGALILVSTLTIRALTAVIFASHGAPAGVGGSDNGGGGGGMRGADDGGHIPALIAATAGWGAHTFDTKMYACAPEFLPMRDEYHALSETLLLPCAVLAAMRVLALVVGDVWAKDVTRASTTDCTVTPPSSQPPPPSSPSSSLSSSKSTSLASATLKNNDTAAANNNAQQHDATARVARPEHVYLLLQLAWFTVMAVLFMRLKLFWVTGLAAAASMLASRSFVHGGGPKARDLGEQWPQGHGVAMTVILAVASVRGWSNVAKPLGVLGQWAAPDEVDLVEWIRTSAHASDAFAGPMDITSLIRTVTGCPIGRMQRTHARTHARQRARILTHAHTHASSLFCSRKRTTSRTLTVAHTDVHARTVNHPHYETAHARETTMKVYSMYSRLPDADIWSTLRNLSANYLVIDRLNCAHKWKEGEDDRFRECGPTVLFDTIVCVYSHPPHCQHLPLVSVCSYCQHLHLVSVCSHCWHLPLV
jgi:hypothetical protein